MLNVIVCFKDQCLHDAMTESLVSRGKMDDEESKMIPKKNLS